jgi:hypothetical protein
MPHEEAARNVRLFARTVMPELQKFDGRHTAIDRADPLPRPSLAMSRRSRSKALARSGDAEVAVGQHEPRAEGRELDAGRAPQAIGIVEQGAVAEL